MCSSDLPCSCRGPDQLQQLRQRPATVAEPVLLFRRQLRGGAVPAARQEQRVIAESPGPARRLRDLELQDPLLARLVDDRASFLKRTTDRIYALIDYEVQSAEMHGDVAVTYGRYVGNIPGSPPGRRWFYVWYEKVYAKRDGRWVYLSHRSVDGAIYGENHEAVRLKPAVAAPKKP